MSAEFFALAFTAALNPKLLAIDLLLIENRRPRAMFLCVLLGGITVGITIGLLDVLVFHVDAINSQKTVSAGVDLALALLLAEPRLGLAMLIGAVCGIPGAAYLSGLHILVTSKSSTANQVIGVILI